MNRRHFLVVLGAVATSAVTTGFGADATGEDVDIFDLGPLEQFEQDKVYDENREKGFFVIRRGEEIFALSSICTHKGCKVRAQGDESFLCKCHKSRFDPVGKVLNGPAQTDLPRLSIKLSEDKHVLVKVPRRA
jgi:Rieske Fe-S protein